MKTKKWLFLTVLLPLATGIQSNAMAAPRAAQIPEPTVVERGPNHRVWQRVLPIVLPNGQPSSRIARYTELAVGLHYLKDGQWLETQEEFELFPDGAIARQGPHVLVLANNINTAGAVDLLSPDGKRFRSHILGLTYTDLTTGRSVMIAAIKDSIGEQIAPNQILYRDAFTDYKADVRYTYTRSGFEQDVIIREKLDSPSVYGLWTQTTRIELFTEFLEAPTPVKERIVVRQEADPILRASLLEPDLVDELLDFGVLTMGSGHALPLGPPPADPFGEDAVPTGKSWETRDGRRLLIEKVDYPSLLPQLEALPESAAIPKPKRDGMLARGGPATGTSFLPAPPPARQAQPKPRMQMASQFPPAKGVVLDYTLQGSLTNFVLRADTTYYVASEVNFKGTTVIESTVVKFTNYVSSPYVRLIFGGPVDCRTGPARPAIFTAKDENTVGVLATIS